MINRILHFYILPLNLIPYYFKYLLFKIINKDLSDTYLEWVNSFHLALLYTNSKTIGSNDKEYLCSLKNQKLTVAIRKFPSSDVLVFNHVFGNPKEYEVIVNSYIKNFKNKKTLNIIDAGSNAGYTSLYFKSIFPDASIVAIEPEENNINIINNNVHNNKLKKVFVLKNALWNIETTLSLITSNLKEWSFHVDKQNNNANETNLVKTITIYKILETYNWDVIDILKIDIEGAEMELLLDLSTCTKTISKAKIIAIEIHDNNQKKNTITKNMTQLGFNVFDSGELTIGINTNL